jgi:hypothetical protein
VPNTPHVGHEATVILLLERQLLHLAEMSHLSRRPLIDAPAGQGPGLQTTIVNKINYSLLFPLLLLLGNLCAAICYAYSGDWKRAFYWAAPSVCIASITF